MIHQDDFAHTLHSDIVSPGARSAALLLHGLSEGDRHWLLTRLTPAERSHLESLLKELSELGMPADDTLLRDALAAGARGDSGRAAVACDPAASLAGAPIQLVAQALAAEPDPLVAALLIEREWPWKDAVLTHLGPLRRSRVLESMRSRGGAARPRASRLNDALVRGLQSKLARLGALPVPAAAELRRPPAGRIATELRRWVRSLTRRAREASST